MPILNTSMPAEVNTQMSQHEVYRAQIQADENNKRIGKPMGAKSEMEKEAFLKLLVTQLRHQDPTRPMEDKEFVSQMAQYSSLEQMRNLNNEMKNLIQSSSSSQAFNLLGKEVDAIIPETKTRIRGEVSSVFFQEGQIMLRVGNTAIGLGDIEAVHKQVVQQDTIVQAVSAQNENDESN